MTGKPPETPPQGAAQTAGGAADGTPRAEPQRHDGEREGPVAIERLSKADGRALILYTREDGR